MVQKTAPWRVLQSSYSFKDKWLSLRSETVQLADGTVLSPYHLLELPDAVCVVALTSALEIVLVEQYRHGAKRVMTELPAGAVDAGEQPLQAIRRELLEETGFAGDDWRLLGTYPANGARHTNSVHAFLALDVREVDRQRLDRGELLVVCKLPWHDFNRRLARGDIVMSSSQLACLFRLQMLVRDAADIGLEKLRI
jgi:8-oxo-dGTP pyrophosphatase MutT (NUDIX family)